MSSTVLVEPSKRRFPKRVLLAIVLVFTVAIAASVAVQQPINVQIDGRREVLAPDATVGALVAAGALDARSGRLLSVTGSVLNENGGGSPLVWRNGQLVGRRARLYDGDSIVSAHGVDRVEARVIELKPIRYKTRVVGRGPVMRLASPGSLGQVERVVGAVSRSVVSSRTVTRAHDMVIRHSRPAPKDKLIALTFDDGPWPGQTDKILDILKHEGVHATFFMLGVRVKKAPQLARRVVNEGNLIGDHTYGHRMLTKEKPKEIKRQIVKGQTQIHRATGVKATWFRPPYGAMNSKVWKQTRTLHLHVALWTVDTRDWSRPGVKRIVKNAQKHARRGAIMLMHDGGGRRDQTIKALPKIIRSLKKRGYIFVTLQELEAAS